MNNSEAACNQSHLFKQRNLISVFEKKQRYKFYFAAEDDGKSRSRTRRDRSRSTSGMVVKRRKSLKFDDVLRMDSVLYQHTGCNSSFM